MKGIDVVLKDGGSYTISEEQIKYWNRLYPNLDIRSELGCLKEMWTVEAIPRKTAKSINKYINRTLYNANKEFEDEYI